MKNNLSAIVLTAVIAAGITFFVTRYLCSTTGQKNALDGAKAQPSANLITANSYPVDSAINDINALQSLASMVFDSLKNDLPPHAGRGVVGYRVSSGDLLKALGVKCEPNASGNCALTWTFPYIRVYLGFNTDKGRFRLFVVPVDTTTGISPCCGSDIFFDKFLNPILPPQIPDSNTSYVLDLISPCPPTCDTNSLLELGIKNQVSCSCDPMTNNHANKK